MSCFFARYYCSGTVDFMIYVLAVLQLVLVLPLADDYGDLVLEKSENCLVFVHENSYRTARIWSRALLSMHLFKVQQDRSTSGYHFCLLCPIL